MSVTRSNAMLYKDEKEYLEGELKSYRKILDMCNKFVQTLADAEVAKYGVSSPHFKEIIYENAGDPYKCNYASLDETEKQALQGLSVWYPRRKWIEERLSILTPMEYKVIKYRYMMSTKATYEWIASVIPCGKNTVIRIIDKAFEKMLKLE